MYKHVYAYTYMCADIHTYCKYIYINIGTDVHMNMYIHLYACIYIYICVQIYIHICTSIVACKVTNLGGAAHNEQLSRG